MKTGQATALQYLVNHGLTNHEVKALLDRAWSSWHKFQRECDNMLAYKAGLHLATDLTECAKMQRELQAYETANLFESIAAKLIA